MLLNICANSNRIMKMYNKVRLVNIPIYSGVSHMDEFGHAQCFLNYRRGKGGVFFTHIRYISNPEIIIKKIFDNFKTFPTIKG